MTVDKLFSTIRHSTDFTSGELNKFELNICAAMVLVLNGRSFDTIVMMRIKRSLACYGKV